MSEKHVQKVCKHHGETKHVLEARGYLRCLKCRSERVVEFRRNRKKKSVEYLGGSCQNCGYSKCFEALEFHHSDPNFKEFGLSADGLTRSWEKVKLELDKCKLLCANCHRETHAEIELNKSK